MNRIKQVMEEKGIKQTWLSERLGKSYSQVNGREIQEVLAHKSEKTTLVYINGRHPKSGSIKTVAEVNQRYKIQKALMG